MFRVNGLRERANREGYMLVAVSALTAPIRCAHDCPVCDYTDSLFTSGSPLLKAQVSEVATVHVSACLSGLSLSFECKEAS